MEFPQLEIQPGERSKVSICPQSSNRLKEFRQRPLMDEFVEKVPFPVGAAFPN